MTEQSQNSYPSQIEFELKSCINKILVNSRVKQLDTMSINIVETRDKTKILQQFIPKYAQNLNCECLYVSEDTFHHLMSLSLLSDSKKCSQYVKSIYVSGSTYEGIYDLISASMKYDKTGIDFGVSSINIELYGKWQLHSSTYLYDFFDNVLYNCNYNLFENLSPSKNPSPSKYQNPSPSKNQSPLKNPKNQKSRSSHLSHSHKSAIKTHNILIFDERCFQPPYVEMETYAVHPYIINLMSQLGSKNNIVWGMIQHTFSKLEIMENMVFLYGLKISEHLYGIAMEITFGLLHVGDSDSNYVEVSQKISSLIVSTLRNNFIKSDHCSDLEDIVVETEESELIYSVEEKIDNFEDNCDNADIEINIKC